MIKTFKTPKGTELPFINLKGKDYLQVAHRLVWFREEHPDWSIKTTLIEHDAEHTVFSAEIRDQAGNQISSAHKSETKGDFRDHLEKAETGSIGRALALCGYGTQFAPELEEGERIVDSPIAPKSLAAEPSSNFDTYDQSDVDMRKCEACGTTLVLSQKKGVYYCPNFKDASRGEHTRAKA